ncbi:MAG TPA: hypothetical protein VFS49_02630 [Croceibacterium sp.]|nr:hypothetical protein [Croceibacterium sp.]
MFDTTFNNAGVNRLATSSIVTDGPVHALTIASGTPIARGLPCGTSADAIGRHSCTAVSSTGTAFPCPPGLDPTS